MTGALLLPGGRPRVVVAMAYATATGSTAPAKARSVAL